MPGPQPGDQRLLGAETVGEESADHPPADRGQPRDADHRRRRHRCDATIDRVGHHVEDRPGMRRAAGEMRARERRELRRAQRTSHRPLHLTKFGDWFFADPDGHRFNIFYMEGL